MALDSSLCCLCLKISDVLLDIFKEKSGNKCFATILSIHFCWFDLKKEVNIGRGVCIQCWSNVDSFHLFYTHVDKVQKQFAMVEEESKPIISTIEVDGQDQSILDCSDSEINPIIKSKSVLDNETVHNSTEIKEGLAISNLTETAADTGASDNSDFEASVMKPNQKSSGKKKLRETSSVEGVNNNELNNQIREQFIMNCEQCNFHFNTFNDAQIHYRTQHRTHGYLRCCNTKYKSRPTVLEHLQRHLNPDEFKCDVCNKTFVNKRGLSIHMDRHLSTEAKPFKCPQCPKSYIRGFLLEKHMESHKNLPKCICDHCGKGYSNKITLNIHKKNVHDRAFFYICDVCAKEFRNKLDFDLHHQNVHNTESQPKVQCKICAAWLKTQQSLRQHMVRHQTIKVMHPCDECDKSFPYRWALRNHIRTLHTKKLFDCNLCDKRFKRSVSLKEHIATHTGVSLYQCQYCPKTFNSSANISSHRKKEHKTEREAYLKLKAIGLA